MSNRLFYGTGKTGKNIKSKTSGSTIKSPSHYTLMMRNGRLWKWCDASENLSSS